jgi:membrane-associated phospholipid phosphatase
MKQNTVLIILLAIILIFAEGQYVHAAVEFQTNGTTPTKTRTPGPSATKGTPPPTTTPSLTPSQTPTTTLAPLPALTLIFPAPTATDTATPTPDSLVVVATPVPTSGEVIKVLPPRLRLLIIFIILLWVFLLGFAIIYLRQFR